MDEINKLNIIEHLKKYMRSMMLYSDFQRGAYENRQGIFNEYLNKENYTQLENNIYIQKFSLMDTYFESNNFENNFQVEEDFIFAYNLQLLKLAIRAFSSIYDENIAYVNILKTDIIKDSYFSNSSIANAFPSQSKRLLYMRNALSHQGNNIGYYIDKDYNIHIKNSGTKNNIPFELTLSINDFCEINRNLMKSNYFDYIFIEFENDKTKNIRDMIDKLKLVRYFSQSKTTQKFFEYGGTWENNVPINIDAQQLVKKNNFNNDIDVKVMDYTNYLRKTDLKKYALELEKMVNPLNHKNFNILYYQAIIESAFFMSQPIPRNNIKRYNYLLDNLAFGYFVSDMPVFWASNATSEKLVEKICSWNISDEDKQIKLIEHTSILCDTRFLFFMSFINYCSEVLELSYENIITEEEKKLCEHFRNAITHGTWSICGDDKIRICDWPPNSKKIDIFDEFQNITYDKVVSVFEILKIIDKIFEFYKDIEMNENKHLK